MLNHPSRLWSQRKSSGVYVLAQSAVAVPSTNTTSEETLATITVPAGIIGLNGALEIITLWTTTNSANNKTPRVRFSGAAGTIFWGPTFTTQVTDQAFCCIRNVRSHSSQKGWSSGSNSGFGSSASAVATATVDTASADTTIVISSQKAVGTETCTLEAYSVKLVRP